MPLRLLFTIFFFGLCTLVSAQTLTTPDHRTLPDRATAKWLQQLRAKALDTTDRSAILPPGAAIRGEQHFPYPVIFVHGLGGAADTWLAFATQAVEWGWSYGGHLAYHLNSDGNHYTTGLAGGAKSDIRKIQGAEAAADFYLVNFHVDTEGKALAKGSQDPHLSNQAAIVKQGAAIADAVADVLKVTGADKVILFGHSLGGLAIREYLQNPAGWPAPGQHRVAKYISAGTPHAGSDASPDRIKALIPGVDRKSDAVRDLRATYAATGEQGIYLFGGVESFEVMDREDRFPYYTTDINCNGTAGESISGLNHKSLPRDLDFATIIGKVEGRNDDGLVRQSSAQLQLLYGGLQSESFYVTGVDADALHTALPDYTTLNLNALDEPDYVDLAYTIRPNHYYNGYISEQADDAEFGHTDYDEFAFTLGTRQPVQLQLDGLEQAAQYSVVDPAKGQLIEAGFVDGNLLTTARTYEPGTYVLEISAAPRPDGQPYAYGFRVRTKDAIVSGVDHRPATALSLSPNPAADRFQLRGPDPMPARVRLINALGQTLTTTVSPRGEVNVAGLTPGLYTVQLPSGVSRKLLKQ